MPTETIRFQFDKDLTGVAIHDAGYITSVSTSGRIVRTHSDESVDFLGIALLSDSVTLSLGQTHFVNINLEHRMMLFHRRGEDRERSFTIPFDNFSFYSKLFDDFDPMKLRDERVLQHFYHGERSMGLPHGDGIGLWPNGAVYVGRWCNGMPTYDCGFGLAHDGSMRWGSSEGTITLTTKGALSFANKRGTFIRERLLMAPFRRIPVHSVFRTHFSHWRRFSQTIASERMMRSLLLSETTPAASAPSGKRSKKKKNRNRCRNARDDRTGVPDVATVNREEEEEAIKVDQEEAATKVEEDEDAMCVICLENLRSHAIVPCGHMCLCQDCAPVVTERCPMCREPMVLAMRIYA